MNLHARITHRRFATVTLLDGTQIRLRSLQRSEQRRWKAITSDKGADQYSDDVLIAMCICDDEGNPIISTDDALTGFFDSWDMADCQLLLRGAFDLCFPKVGEGSLVEQVGAALKNLKAIRGNGSASAGVTPTDAPATNSTPSTTTAS